MAIAALPTLGLAVRRLDYLSTPDKLKFQQNNWRAERMGWGALATVVLAALLGLFGDGALSNDEAASADGELTVAYRHFLRAESPAKLTVTTAPALVDDGHLAIWVDADYLAGFEIRSVEPEPESTVLGADRTTFHFETNAETATRALTVTFRLVADEAGFASGAVGAGTARVELRQFVYP